MIGVSTASRNLAGSFNKFGIIHETGTEPLDIHVPIAQGNFKGYQI